MNMFKDLESLDTKVGYYLSIYIVLSAFITIPGNAVNPIIRVYMITNVDPIWFKVNLLVDAAISGILSLLIKKEWIIFMKENFGLLLLIDFVFLLVSNAAGVVSPAARYVLLSLQTPLVTAFIFKVLGDVINNVAKGSDLTIIDQKMDGFFCLSTISGITISILIPENANIEFILAIQILSIGSNSLCCYYFKKKVVEAASLK